MAPEKTLVRIWSELFGWCLTTTALVFLVTIPCETLAPSLCAFGASLALPVLIVWIIALIRRRQDDRRTEIARATASSQTRAV